MDPNETLNEIRDLMTESQKPGQSTIALADLADDLVSSLRALDEWLSRGGFLPEPWKRTGAMGTNQ